MIQVTHEQLISCLRQYADELAAMPLGNRVEAYRVGGCNERLFECGLWIRAEVTEEQCLSRMTDYVGDEQELVDRQGGWLKNERGELCCYVPDFEILAGQLSEQNPVDVLKRKEDANGN